MKKKLFMFLGLALFITILLPESSFAQGGKKRRGEPTKPISDADKAIVIDIFRALGPTAYYLEFNRGSEQYGSTTAVTAEQLTAIREKQIPAGTENYLIGSYYYGMGMVYIIKTRVRATLDQIFGKTDAARLEAIINKYTSG